MVLSGSLQFPPLSEIRRNREPLKYLKYVVGRGNQHLRVPALSSSASRQDLWSRRVSAKVNTPMCSLPDRLNVLRCHSFLFWGQNVTIPTMKTATMALTRSCDALQGSFFVTKFGSAIGIILFALWGLRPLLRISRDVLLHKTDSSWKKSSTYYVMTSYLQPILLWTGAMLICRGFDPIAMPTETSQLVKQKLLTFGKSLSTVLAFAYCLSSAIQQAQNYLTETNDPAETKNMGFQFAGKAIYTAVWVAAVSLFMELLGFSTQKWLTAGGLGTVLLTLAGREIFTNFLSSAMIHATRPFVVNDWIQTKIEGYEVSGHVEHVGWWSPTIIRGEDREAIHIPNHKFTMNVVRNLTQKSHWRIKTHLAISHLDVSKINIIVADMRKVLAKNPHVEQQRLHRRVFLENVNPENQALTILISCFVKTSHFEEYLCVKEVILLDLLRVIRHHRARLATPIRTIQNVYNDVDLDSIPFSDTIFTRNRPASRRPLLLIEPSQKINGEDKSKPQSRSGRKSGGERENGSTGQLTPDPKADSKTRGTPTPPEPNNTIDTTREVEDDNKLAETSNSESRDENKAVGVGSSKSSPKVDGKATALKRPSSELESNGENVLKKNSENMSPKGNVETHGMDGKSTSGPTSGSESPKSGPTDVMEENIVLGVAWEGSKRTLPIEEEEEVNSREDQGKEQVAARNNGHAISASEKDDKEE